MINQRPLVHNENRGKNIARFRRFWVKELRHSETIFAKKRYTSILARVGEDIDLSSMPFQDLKSLIESGTSPRWDDSKNLIRECCGKVI